METEGVAWHHHWSMMLPPRTFSQASLRRKMHANDEDLRKGRQRSAGVNRDEV